MTLTIYNSLGQNIAPVNSAALVSTPFSSGSSLTISSLGSDVLVQCTTTAGGPYTLTVPTSTGSLFKIIVADRGTVTGGTFSTYVTISPSTGSITGLSVLNITGMSITIIDGAAGWSSI